MSSIFVQPDPRWLSQPICVQAFFIEWIIFVPNVSNYRFGTFAKPYGERTFSAGIQLDQTEKSTATAARYSVLSITTLDKRAVNYHCWANSYFKFLLWVLVYVCLLCPPTQSLRVLRCIQGSLDNPIFWPYPNVWILDSPEFCMP